MGYVPRRVANRKGVTPKQEFSLFEIMMATLCAIMIIMVVIAPVIHWNIKEQPEKPIKEEIYQEKNINHFEGRF